MQRLKEELEGWSYNVVVAEKDQIGARVRPDSHFPNGTLAYDENKDTTYQQNPSKPQVFPIDILEKDRQFADWSS